MYPPNERDRKAQEVVKHRMHGEFPEGFQQEEGPILEADGRKNWMLGFGDAKMCRWETHGKAVAEELPCHYCFISQC